MTSGSSAVAKAERPAIITRASEADRQQALMRAVGLDRLTEAERELALAVANRYELDLLLKHLVIIDGRGYITRDALIHIAHRSRKLDGIEQSLAPEIRPFQGIGECWYAETTVWRKDMTKPFKYGGRYPVNAQNKKYGPEMAIKVSECMSLRRAFDVSAPTVEEQWDVGNMVGETEPEKPQTLAEKVAAQAAAVAAETTEHSPAESGEAGQDAGAAVVTAAAPDVTEDAPGAPCMSTSPIDDTLCDLEVGHKGAHKNAGQSW